MSSSNSSYPIQSSQPVTAAENVVEFYIRNQPGASDQATRIKNKTAPLLGENPLNGKIDNVEKLKRIARDFRSDTITIPSDEMFVEMALASRGDDVYGEDETTNTFQAEMAALTGKQAALFLPSGTLSNQLALRTHLHQPPYAILCDARSHIHRYEAGGIAFHCGASTELVTPSNGHHLRWEDVLPNLFLDEDVHFAPTKIVSLENTLNGTIFPQDEIVKISTEAKKLGLIMHLDGARIWNVAAETGLSLKELCAPFDTVSLCLSKGLGAPVGSVLVGPASFIKKVKHFRKLYGAGVRQIGPMIAAARFAVLHNYPKLAATHQLAKYAARELEKLGVRLTAPVETSMVFMDTSPLDIPISELVARAASLASPIKLGGGRMVFHHQIDRAAIDDLVKLIETMVEEKTNPTIPPASSLTAKESGVKSTGIYSASTNGSHKGGIVFRAIGSANPSYGDTMKHCVSLTLPFPNRQSALTLQKVVSVDKELRPKETRKEFTILPSTTATPVASPPQSDDEEEASDQLDPPVELGVKIFATTVRQLRLSVNAFLEDSAVICRTLSEFDPLQKQLDEVRKLELETQLEQGSIGIAG